MKKLNYIFLLFLPIILLFGCEQEEGYDVNVGPKPELSVLDLLSELGQYNTFVKAATITGLDEQLASSEEKTVLAPTDAAFVALFARMGVDKLEDIPQDQLREILEYHISSGAVRGESLPRKIASVKGSPVFTFSAAAGTLLNGKAVVSQVNRTGVNGIVHGISFVLDPPKGSIIDELQALNAVEAEDAPGFSLLLYALERAELTATLASSDNFTLLAPTDAAFTAAGLADEEAIDAMDLDALKSLLKYHVLGAEKFSQEFAAGRIYTLAGGEGDARGLDVTAGDAISFSGTAISAPNQAADNGVVHIVNSLVRPYRYLADVLFNGNARSIAYYATNNFYRGINQANLADRFRSETRFHILSPSNNAVNQLLTSLGATSWADLTEAQITEIVDRHTFDADFSVAANIGAKVTNALGEQFFVTQNSKGVSINGKVGENNEEIARQNMFIPGFGTYANPYFDASAAIYNGKITAITKALDRIGALPSQNLSEVMANDSEADLFAAALAKTGVLKTGSSYTVFAVKNSAFTAATGYADVADIEALDATDDAAKISALATYLNRHISTNLRFRNDMTVDLPSVTTAAGTFRLVMVNTLTGKSLAIQDASKNPATSVLFEATDRIANNGVYHIIERSIVY